LKRKIRSPRSPRISARIETAAPAFTYVATANEYARGVVSGRILACKWVKLACQRHLDDLAKSKRPGFAYAFDETRANRVCRFLEQLPHTKGKWAANRETIRLEPWQCFVETVIFGWIRVRDGKRRFREAYICVPRKNGKSIIAGGTGNYMFAADGEFGAEVYSGATSEKQAWEVFGPAQKMVQRTEQLSSAFGIEVRAKSMVIMANGSKFEPVIGKPGDGGSPSCAIIDEYHEHDTDDLYDTMRTGMGAREQPLALVITTSGSDVAGPCRALQADVEKVLEGVIERDELFGIIYTIDDADDWTSEASLRKANPNYDVSVFGDFLKTEQANAVRDARKQNIFKTKHLNIWVNAKAAWMNMQSWNAMADPSLKAEEFKGLPCYVGVDLASKKDITARVKVFRKRIDNANHYYAFGDFYLPAVRAELPEFQHYQKWVKEGKLKTTPGSAIDFDTITADTINEVLTYRISEVAYDPWGGDQFAQHIAHLTPAKAIGVPQQVRWLSEPMKQTEALVIDGRLHHDGNPALTWMVSNVIAKLDAKDNIYPNKEKPDSMIDGAVALILGMSRAIVGEGSGSVYETRGMLVLGA
jgi:phage terminase large subunit-like protein